MRPRSSTNYQLPPSFSDSKPIIQELQALHAGTLTNTPESRRHRGSPGRTFHLAGKIKTTIYHKVRVLSVIIDDPVCDHHVRPREACELGTMFLACFETD